MHVRAVMRYHYFTGLPEDVVTNTVHWWVDTTDFDVAANVVAARLAPGMDALGPLMPACVSRDCEILVYDLAEPEPRTPKTFTNTIPAASVAAGLPLEVCLVASFSAYPPATARRRGRLYLGPFNTGQQIASTSSTFPRPQPAMVTGVAAVAAGWAALGTSPDNNMVIYSRAAGAFYNVTGGWVNDEFDTQRRRGVRESTRTTWTV